MIGLLTAVLAATTIPLVRPSHVAAHPPPSWEYTIEAIPDQTFAAKMNELGAHGWELVFARRASNGETGAAMEMSYECIFKRAK